MKKQNYLLLGAIVFALTVFSCKKEKETPAVTATKKVVLTVNNLQPLSGDFAYEAWLVNSAGEPTSVGNLTVDSDAATADTFTLTANADVVDAATSFAVTIESTTDGDAKPSFAFILGGTFGNTTDKDAKTSFLSIEDDSDNLNIVYAAEHQDGDAKRISESAGTFILATPSDGADTNETSGVWWKKSDSNNPGLVLPSIDDSHWQYEGWVIINDTPVSTGKFGNGNGLSPGTGADEAVAFYNATGSEPMYPGEDFLINAPTGLTFPRDLSGAKVAITIEPVPDNSTAPFPIKVLEATIPASATPRTVDYDMTNVTLDTTKGTLTVPYGAVVKE